MKRELDILNKEAIVNIVREVVGEQKVKVDEPMKNHTSFKVGGPADVLVMPKHAEEIADIIRLCNAEGIPLFIMGNGTNLIVRDKGIRGIVLKIFDNFDDYKVEDEMMEVQAGMLLSKVSNIALKNSLSGVEFASGIPGTLGGAVTMNAGAYGGEMKDVVVKTEYVDQQGNIKTIEGDGHQFGYRSSVIQKEGGVVLKSRLQLKKGDPEEIRALMDDLNGRRKEKQPLEMPSAGSVFKRPEGYFAGKLVQDSGLKGYCIGGAEVSTKHCGFIVNRGNAKADDIIHLIEHIKKSVNDQHGVHLQTEVKIVGEE